MVSPSTLCRLRSDPRIKKALSAQFNQTTLALTNKIQSVLPNVPTDPRATAAVADPRLKKRLKEKAAASNAAPAPVAVPVPPPIVPMSTINATLSQTTNPVLNNGFPGTFTTF